MVLGSGENQTLFNDARMMDNGRDSEERGIWEKSEDNEGEVVAAIVVVVIVECKHAIVRKSEKKKNLKSTEERKWKIKKDEIKMEKLSMKEIEK